MKYSSDSTHIVIDSKRTNRVTGSLIALRHVLDGHNVAKGLQIGRHGNRHQFAVAGHTDVAQVERTGVKHYTIVRKHLANRGQAVIEQLDEKKKKVVQEAQ